MEETEDDILCRLCLQNCVDGRPLEGFISYKLKFIVPIINLDVSYDPKICSECVTDLMAHYKFKSTCLENNEPTHNFMELELLTKKNDAMSIYMRNEEKRKKCSLCHGKNTLGELKESEDKLLRVMLEKCLPDLDDLLPTVCKNCMDSLTNLFKFVSHCMETEAKIKNYFYLKGLNGQSKINLDAMIQFILNAEKKEYVSCGDENKGHKVALDPTQIKSEPIFDEAEPDDDYDDIPMDIKCEPEIEIEEGPHRKQLEDYINKQSKKLFVIVERPTENITIPITSKKNTDQPTETNDESLESKSTNIQLNNKQETETSSQTNSKDKQTQNKTTTTISEDASKFLCSLCSFKAKKESDIERHITFTHKNLPGNRIYKCGMCSYVTKNQKLLSKHRKKFHERADADGKFQCQACSYTTKTRRNIRRHVLKHTKASEVTVYSCESCSYSTENKSHFSDHELVHKSWEDVPVYRCSSCPYWTKRRRDLPRHLSTMHGLKRSEAHEAVFGCEDICE